MFWMAKVPDNNSEVYDVGDRRLTLKPTSHSHKKTTTGITLMQVAVKLYRRTYFLECLQTEGFGALLRGSQKAADG